jgi:hypothetical protein
MNKFFDLLIFLTTVYGASYIFTVSVLLNEPRAWLTALFDKRYETSTNSFIKFGYDKLAYLINCTICASVWLAFFFYFVFQSSILISISSNEYDLLIYMMLSPVFTMYLNGILMEEETESND